MSKQRPKILAISSGGGHWVQLLRLRPAFEGGDVLFATTRPGYESDLDQGERFTVIPDATRWSKIGLVKSALSILLLLLRERPDVVITTGAAPGYFAIRMARIIGSKTVWVDSVANVEELSMSGRKAGPHVDLWLTQWSHLAVESGPQFHGSVV